MNESDQILFLLEELTILLTDLLTKEDRDEMNRNLFYLKNDYQELKKANDSIKNIEMTNNHDLATQVIAISGRCFVDIIQELENIKDVLRHIQKTILRAEK